MKNNYKNDNHINNIYDNKPQAKLDIIIESSQISYNILGDYINKNIVFEQQYNSSLYTEKYSTFHEMNDINAQNYFYETLSDYKIDHIEIISHFWNEPLINHSKYYSLLYLFDYVNNANFTMYINIKKSILLELTDKIYNDNVQYLVQIQPSNFLYNYYENLKLNIQSLIVDYENDYFFEKNSNTYNNMFKFILNNSSFLTNLKINNINISPYFNIIYNLPYLDKLILHNKDIKHSLSINQLLMLSNKLSYLEIKEVTINDNNKNEKI